MTHYVAVDTETTLIPERQTVMTRGNDTINVSPYVTPDLVVVSIADSLGSWLNSPDEFKCSVSMIYADPDVHFVFHNAAFDLDVLAKAGIDLYGLVEQGRVHDTMILDWLVRLANGEFDTPRRNPETGTWACDEARMRSLATLASDLARMDLTKDPAVRCGFGAYLGKPVSEIPPEFREYSRKDAVATYRVWCALRNIVEAKQWGDLGEPLQVQASIATAALDKRGVCIDRGAAARVRDRFLAQIRPFEEQLVASGFGAWGATTVIDTQELPGYRPRAAWAMERDGLLHDYRGNKTKNRTITRVCRPKFRLRQAPVQAELAKLEVDDPTQIPRRADGTISIDLDFWSPFIDADHPLSVWKQWAKLRKVLDTYLDTYSKAERVFPRWWVLGARSGRMSASRPNVQNVSKRKAGIRALFVPAPGHVFVKADYTAQEMFTLAESMDGLGIRGNLGRILRGGHDVHREGAALALGKPAEAVTKDERQGQKVLNFGVPGGLGPKKLARYAADNYGIRWTVDQAREARKTFLSTFPDIREYLSLLKDEHANLLAEVTGRTEAEWRVFLSLPADADVYDALLHSSDTDLQGWAIQVERGGRQVRLKSGRIRTNCTFTERANTYFQGLASDVTKRAFWLAHRAGLRIVLVVHDEIVVEATPDAAEAAGKTLAACMKQAFVDLCPRMGSYAGVAVETGLKCWGPATTITGEVMEI